MASVGIKVAGGGAYVVDVPGFKEIPKDPGLVSAMMSAINATASQAGALANEHYTTNSHVGKFRTYVEARGQEPDTAGYWRGKRVQALWSSRPRMTDTGSR